MGGYWKVAGASNSSYAKARRRKITNYRPVLAIYRRKRQRERMKRKRRGREIEKKVHRQGTSGESL